MKKEIKSSNSSSRFPAKRPIWQVSGRTGESNFLICGFGDTNIGQVWKTPDKKPHSGNPASDIQGVCNEINVQKEPPAKVRCSYNKRSGRRDETKKAPDAHGRMPGKV